MMRILLPWERIIAWYWNHRWRQNNVYYGAKGGSLMDVKATLYLDSLGYYTLSKVVRQLRVFTDNSFDENATIDKIRRHVNRRIQYVPDIDNYGKPEFWSDALTTYTTKKGDCDDCSILIKVLSLLAGIPDFKVKCAWVSVYDKKGNYAGEHLNNLFLNKWGWEFIEGTYYPYEYWSGKYGNIKFTFNRQYSWAQHEITMNADDLKQLTEVIR